MAPTKEQIANLVKQTHPKFQQKRDMWIQISRTYSGGIEYRDGDYLHRFSQREPLPSYNARKKRAVHFNNTQPLADVLSGYLFAKEPERKNYSAKYLIEKPNLFQDINSFMQTVALNSLMYSCGILVDSPKFNTEFIQTKADRQNNGLNPYAVFYYPWQIRNFAYDKRGNLIKLLLDNSNYDNSDFFAKATIEYKLTYWTPEYFQNFISTSNNTGTGQFYGLTGYDASFIAEEPQEHPCGEIPFQFINWKDRTLSHLTDTIFDDVVLFDQAVYNYMSLMDEMLFGGVFKYVFWPGEPPEVVNSPQGISNSQFLSFDPAATHAPFFAGPGLGDVGPFLAAMQFYLSAIKRTLGLDTDAEKTFVQSGKAKELDFTKVVSLLTSGATMMESVEKTTHRHSGLWEGNKNQTIDVEYRKDFLAEDEKNELEGLIEAWNMPYRVMKKYIAQRIAEINLADKIDEKEMDEIKKDIEETEAEPETPQVNPKTLALMEKMTQEQSKIKEQNNERTV